MRILLLVGPSGVGKTTTCLRIIALAREHDLRVAGVLSLPIYDSQVKSAINLHEIISSRERTLARIAPSGIEADIGIWSFDPNTILWGQELLGCLPACDLLVIDEIGPLEIQMGKGLTNAMTALHRAEYHLALVSLRPSMIEALVKLLPGVKISVYWLDKNNRNLMPESIIAGYEKDERWEMIYADRTI
ncbi:MAG TPA: nucleoside-triphosphatase [Anaerolineales bacterium]|nr:nucleoside-triphosphatase [Anaerolineales bacterium]